MSDVLNAKMFPPLVRFTFNRVDIIYDKQGDTKFMTD